MVQEERGVPTDKMSDAAKGLPMMNKSASRSYDVIQIFGVPVTFAW